MNLSETEIAKIISAVIAQTRTEVTFKKLIEDYLELHAKKKKSFKKDVGYIRNYIEPSFGNIPLSSITARQVEQVFALWSMKHPIAANRALEILRVMFRKAIRWGYMSGTNPASEIDKNPEKPRERYITADEMPSLREALQKESVAVQAAFRMYVYTDARKEEILDLTWGRINWTEKYALFPRTKNGRAFPCSLPDICIEWLQKLPRKSEFVFPGMFINTRMDMDKIWRRIRARAGLSDVTIHDMRRTCGTWLRAQGFTTKDIADAFNHLDPKSTERYAIPNQAKVRTMLDRGASAIEAFLS